MKNAIYKICEKLRGCSEEDEYFEVLQIQQNKDNKYVVTVQAIDAKSETQEQGDDQNER